MRRLANISLLGPAALAAWLAANGARADEWTPGTPHPEYPHVVAGTEPGSWVPEFGWKFANARPGDPAVTEIREPDIVLENNGEPTAAIPAPAGFWSPEAGTPLAGMLAAAAKEDTANRVLGNWVAYDGRSAGLMAAGVKEPLSIEEKRMSLAAFAERKREFSDLAQTRLDELAAEVGEGQTAAGGKVLSEMTGIETVVGIDGIRILPPYRDESDRLCFTMIRSDSTSANGQTFKSHVATSCALLWLRGRIVTLYVGSPAGDADAVDAAADSSREVLDKWLAAVDAANPGSVREIDESLRDDPDCVRAPGEETGKFPWLAAAAIALAIAVLAGGWLVLRRRARKGAPRDRKEG